MKTQDIAAIIVFAALTVALNPAISGIGIPFPLAPYLVYQLWEIPLVIVFLMYGYKYGTFVATMNAFVLLAIFIGPGGLLAGPFYNLIAIIAMMIGVYIPFKISTIRNNSTDSTGKNAGYGTKLIVLSTVLGVIMRVIVMTIVNYAVLRLDYPLGYSMPEIAILAEIPLIALFNATLALYTIPIGYVITNAIKRNLKK